MIYSDCVLLGVLLIIGYTNAANKREFPKGFSFGTASAAYQVEGAWNLDGKGENIWDNATHKNPELIKNSGNADIAADFFHKYKEDIATMAGMGLTHYRFSIAWSRLLPTGFADKTNTKAIMFYQDVLYELEKYKIEPLITMYHWDLPQPLHEQGGWQNPKIVDYFVDYARVLFRYFPDVKYWSTINEPQQVCPGGYGYAYLAPFINKSGTADYQCIYNVLKAHAAAYHLYKKEFPQLKGKITMVLDSSWSMPRSNQSEDIEAADRRNQFMFGIYAHPLYHGDWPKVVKERVNFRSEKEHQNKSRLPQFTQQEIDSIKGTTDYMSLNYYESHLVSNVEESSDYSTVNYEKDMRIKTSDDPSWEKGHDGKAVVPYGFKQLLKWIWKTYNKPDIIITENGISDDGAINDTNRIYFIADHLNVLLDVMQEDNMTILGYTHWSLTDTFEWVYGYTEHFGLHQVDFHNDNRTRIPKKSVEFYKKIATTKQISDLPPRPNITTTTTATTAATATTATTAITATTFAAAASSTSPTARITTTAPQGKSTRYNFHTTTFETISTTESSAEKFTYLAFLITSASISHLLLNYH